MNAIQVNYMLWEPKFASCHPTLSQRYRIAFMATHRTNYDTISCKITAKSD